MPITNPNKPITKQNLSDFYQGILPYLGGKADAGFTPIGTIIPMIAESAPANYLKCNGATYNKSDYPELAAHLLSMTYNTPYIVSGDDTKFKVPDLRGEFLRGISTNGHTGEGNGARVGEHQTGTEIPYNMFSANGARSNGFINSTGTSQQSRINASADKLVGSPDKIFQVVTTEGTLSSSQYECYKVRPTNTSVLFCIATKNIYLDPKNDYSTEEKVIGTWINNEPLYQKTFALDNITGTTAGTFKSIVTDISSLNIDFIADIRGIIRSESSFQVIDYRENNGGQQLKLQASTTSLQLVTNMAIDGMKYWVTLRYTKTS